MMLNNFMPPSLYPAFPELFLLAMSFLILIADLIFGKTQRWVVANLTLLTLLGCALLTALTADGMTVLTFSNMFVDDTLGDFIKLMIYLTVAMTLLYGGGYLAARGLDKGEFYLVVLYATLGMMVMTSAARLLTM
jgi:NADH-quinone oxidoreductase subunit N